MADGLGLSEARSDVKAEIARTDTKASLLLAFNGVAVAGIWTACRSLHPAMVVLVPAGVAGLLLAASIAVLLLAARPRIGDTTAGFPRWATLTAEELTEELAEDRRAEHVVILARIAVVKMRGMKQAIDLTLAAGGLVLVAALAAAVTA